MNDGLYPTFRDNKDRVVFLLSEYRFLITLVLLGFLAYGVYYGFPNLPRWIEPVIKLYLVSSLPMSIAGSKYAKWLRERNWVPVHENDAVREVQEKWMVPPETWREKIVEHGPPRPINDGSAWQVRELRYHEDTGRLEVTGLYLAALSDMDLQTSKNHFKRIYAWLYQEYLKLSTIRDNLSTTAAEIQAEVLREAALAREKGTMLDPRQVQGMVQEMIQDIEDNVEPSEPPAGPRPTDLIDEQRELAEKGKITMRATEMTEAVNEALDHE